MEEYFEVKLFDLQILMHVKRAYGVLASQMGAEWVNEIVQFLNEKQAVYGKNGFYNGH